MRVRHDASAAAATEQLVQRLSCDLGLDVPKRRIDCGDGCHGDGASAPVSTFVKVLPDVFNLLRVTANQARDDVLF